MREYTLNFYDLGTFALCCFIIGVFAAGAIGGWLERRRNGRRPFVVNPSIHFMEPITAEELEHLLREEHEEQKARIQ